jgi:cytochrome c5
MSQNEHEAGHESPIKTPKQLITVIALAFLVPILIIVMLSQFVANMRSVDMDSPGMANDAVAKRLKPVGDLAFAEPGGSAAQAPKGGEDIYKSVCSACHASGAAGAPKFADKGDWAARLKQGQKTLLSAALKGKGAMPPRGGGADLSDLEVERALVYMANQAGAKFKEPAAPAPEKTPAAAPAQDKAAPAAPAPEKTAAGAGAADKADGKKIYEATCVVCHGTGVAGAPKAGDKAAWAPRLKTGANALYASALKGKGAMPAKGGNAALADADVKAAVDYLMGLAK